MKRFLIFIIILILILLGYLVYDSLSYMNVTVKFDKLEPFEKQMNVYFKGFKVGKTTEIYANKDYTGTYLKLKLLSRRAKFPSNISVKIRKKKIGGYVDIIYPDVPALKHLKNNDEIKGYIAKDISSLMESENIENIVVEAENLVESANTAIKSLNGIFVEVQKIIIDNRSSIDLTIRSLANTASNLENVSDNLNNALDKDSLTSSVDNIEAVTGNIKQITDSLNDVAYQIDNTTMPIVNCILCETNAAAGNVKEITGGVKHTLEKHMGLGRLMFGRPISKDCR